MMGYATVIAASKVGMYSGNSLLVIIILIEDGTVSLYLLVFMEYGSAE